MNVQTLLVTVLTLTAAGCSKPPAEEMYATAREAQKARKFPLAIEAYTKVCQEYPQSTLADTSMFTIATIRQNDMSEYIEAVNAYKQYIEKYPTGVFAPLASFLIGYIYNNDLHNLDSAAAAYRLFLARYPHHEMAASAQFELENLGKPPDQIFPKQVATQEPAQPPGKPQRTPKR